MVSAQQDVLPIEGFTRTDAAFFAESFADTAEQKTELYLRGEALRKGYESPFWRWQEKEARAAGRLLVPAVVMDDMRYTALLHGCEVEPEDLEPHNPLWDYVLDSVVERRIQANDGEDAGYVLSVAAFDLSRASLVSVLEADHQEGENIRLYNFPIHYEDEEA